MLFIYHHRDSADNKIQNRCRNRNRCSDGAREGRSVPLGESSRLHSSAWIVTAQRQRIGPTTIDVLEKHFGFIDIANLNFNLTRSHNSTTDNR